MPTTSPSLRGRAVALALRQALGIIRRLGVGPDNTVGTDGDQLDRVVTSARRQFEALAARGRLPPDTRVEAVSQAPVPGEWVRPTRYVDSRRVVLHLHGGAYVLGSPATHRLLVRALARVSHGVGWVPAYRLAPEHRFPAALDDAVATYRWLVEDQDVDPARIAVMGDSAGGGLAIALLMRLRDEGRPLPACAVGLSPWVDLTGASPSVLANDGRDAMFGRVPDGIVPRLADLYADDLTHPYVSPLHGDLGGLPPVLVHVGGDELLRDDGLRLAVQLRAAGVDASAGSFPGMWHVFQAFPAPESTRSLREIGGFVRRHTTGRATGR